MQQNTTTVINVLLALATAWIGWQQLQTQRDVARLSFETSYRVVVDGPDLVFVSASEYLREVSPVYVTPKFRSPENQISFGQRVELPRVTSESDMTERKITFRNVFSPNGTVCSNFANRSKCRDEELFRLEIEYQQNGIQDTTNIAGPRT